MRQYDDVVRKIEDNPLYADPDNPGIVRGGWFGSGPMDGMLVGSKAQFVVDAINEYVKIHVDKARG